MATEVRSLPPFQNLKAYRAASLLQTELFWLSRAFPSSLARSLTQPLRKHAHGVTQEVSRTWRNRRNSRHANIYIERTLDELWMLTQYVLRAYEEEVITADQYALLTGRLEDLSLEVRRLRSNLTIAA